MNMVEFLQEIDNFKENLSPEAQDFLEDLKNQNTINKMFTENGIKILKCMKENAETYLNIFSSKQLGELLFMTPRSVSGSIRKLIIEGYITKSGANPVMYSLTDLGKELEVDNL